MIRQWGGHQKKEENVGKIWQEEDLRCHRSEEEGAQHMVYKKKGGSYEELLYV